MSDITEFLETIRLDPDSDLPRLVFADWLEERGDTDRAEFIRVQCELPRLQPHEKRWRDLRDRELHLLRVHEQEWLGLPRALLNSGEFRRGFLASVSMSVEAFIRDAETVFAGHPVVHEAQLHWGEARRMSQLPDCTWLARLRSLNLDGTWLHGPVVSALVRSPYLSDLESLSLAETDLRPRDIEALASSEVFAGLRTLVLRSNYDLGNSGAAILAGPSALKRLNVLDLSETHIGTGGAKALAASSRLTGQLTRLCLSGNGVPERMIRLLQSRFGKRLVL